MHSALFYALLISFMTLGNSSCPIGNYWNTAQLRCDPCEYGKYKDTVGSTLCTSCNPGYSSSNGASTCMLCTIANAQVASTGGWAGYCTCNKGYYGTIINPGCDIELGCSLYHNAYGGGGCTACAAGKYYWQPFTYGNTDSNQCADCPASHPYSAPGSITCTTTAPVPTTCPTGQYLPSTSSSACELCTAGTYKASTGTAACQDCAAFSTSPAGSSAVTQCTCNAGYEKIGDVCVEICNAGYTSPGGGVCTACAAGTYKAVSGSAACNTCLPGKFSGATGQSSSGTCQNCLAGKWSLHGFAACEDCREGTYGPNAGADCIYCPQGKFSAATGQSSSVSCQNCNAGTYSNLLGASVCTSCPAGSTSPAASNFKTQCFCNAGFVGGFVGGFETTVTEKACQDHPTYLKAGMKCDHWAEGHPSGNNPYCVLDGVCNRCCASCRNRCEGAGQYLETCQQYCWNLGPATNVTKIVPYDSCTACDAGKYKSSAGGPEPGDCLLCETGKYSAAGSSACQLCPAASTSPAGSSAVTQCTCNAGYDKVGMDPFVCQLQQCAAGSTGPAGSCTLCVAGKYKAVTGSAACDDCGAGKFSAATGQSSSATCQNCVAGKFSAATGQSTCQDCPAQSTSPAGSSADTSCACNTGYSGTAGTCTQCSANTYKATTGSEACSLCPGNSISAAGSTALSSCSCVAGYTGPNGGPCVLCDTGKYKSAPGSIACTQCPAFSTSPAGSSASTQCTCNYAGATGPNGGPCTCNPGYTGIDGILCRMCPWAYYKTSSGSASCTACGQAGISSDVTIPGVPATSFADCKNYAGMAGYVKCPKDRLGGSFNRWSSNNAPCVQCPADMWATEERCECSSGYQGLGMYMNPDRYLGQGHGVAVTEVVNAGCTICPAGTYKNGGIGSQFVCVNCTDLKPFSTSVAGCTEQTQCCQCLRGYGHQLISNVAVCVICPAGKYKETIGGNVGCKNCGADEPAFSYSTAIGATSRAVCGCDVGHYYSSSFGACRSCPVDTYQNQYSRSETCINCPVNTTTYGSQGVRLPDNSQNGCLCKPGFTGPAGGPCTQCAFGKWGQGRSDACRDCPCDAGSQACPSTVTAGASYDSSCACPAGYIGGAFTCIACAAGTYKDSTYRLNWITAGSYDVPSYHYICTTCPAGTYATGAATVCTACPANSFSQVTSVTIPPKAGVSWPIAATTFMVGGTSLTSCTCNSGYQKVGTNPFECIGLPCNAGYTGPAGSCTACIGGKYKTTTGSAACDDCAAAKFSAAAGQSSSSTCQDCLAGKYASLTGSSVCENCLAGKYSTATGQSSSVTCQDCLSGKYSTATGQTTCQDCLAGKYSTLTGQSSSGTCQDCSAGKFSGLTGQSSLDTCQDCSAGKYSTATGQSSTGTCQNCATGKFSALTGQSSSATCENCLEGKYSALTGQSSPATCLDCLAGKYSTATGQSACQDCLAGKYSTGTGQSSSGTCEDCLAGKYATATGQSSSDTCQDCSAGKYSTTTGQSSSATCQNCLAGKYSLATGQSSSGTCQDCLAGKYSSATGQSSAATCQDCLAGKYSAATGQSTSATCQNCLAGTYATLTGSTVCENCLAGKYSAATGQSSAATCQDCLPGKFNSATAQSSCQDCPALSSSSAGSSECFCNPGYWDSYASCKQCPLGKYRDHVCLTTPCAQNTCLACPSGTYAPTTGQSACTKCPVGKSGINT
jgi:hypothetical protein